MIGISSYDAGGAEYLSEFVINNRNNYLFFVDGPAKKIFQKKIRNFKVSNFKNSINKLDYVISSTGWSSNHEKKIIYTCKKKNIKICAFIDHWVNYKERFLINKKLILPDEIWVGDNDALKIAKKKFKQKKIRIKKIKNFYLEKIKKFFLNKKNKKNKKFKNILYLSEPIIKNKITPYKEEECLDLFFEKIQKFKKIKKITFRPHPHEKFKKYKWLSKLKKYKVVINKQDNLLKEIWDNDIIIGCNTMALFIATFAKKKVYTSVPKGYKCIIPSKKIRYLNNI